MKTNSIRRTLVPLLFWTILALGIMIAIVESLDVILMRRVVLASVDDLEFMGLGNTVLQDTRNGCGPAVVKMILDHYRIPAAVESLRSELSLGPHGTTMLSLKASLEHHGLGATGLRMPIDQLAFIPVPAILFVRNNHFVVFDSMGTVQEYYLRDPTVGRIRLTPDRLRSMWHGEVLVVKPHSEIRLTSEP